MLHSPGNLDTLSRNVKGIENKKSFLAHVPLFLQVLWKYVKSFLCNPADKQPSNQQTEVESELQHILFTIYYKNLKTAKSYSLSLGCTFWKTALCILLFLLLLFIVFIFLFIFFILSTFSPCAATSLRCCVNCEFPLWRINSGTSYLNMSNLNLYRWR